MSGVAQAGQGAGRAAAAPRRGHGTVGGDRGDGMPRAPRTHPAPRRAAPLVYNAPRQQHENLGAIYAPGILFGKALSVPGT